MYKGVGINRQLQKIMVIKEGSSKTLEIIVKHKSWIFKGYLREQNSPQGFYQKRY